MSAAALITGAGVIGPCGRGVQALWRSLCTGESNRCEIEHFDTYGSPIGRAGLVPGQERRAGEPDRVFELLLAAVRDALEDAGVSAEREVALVVATTDAGGNALASRAGARGTAPASELHAFFPGWLARRVGERLALRGARLTVSTASASGGSALCVARDLLAAGDARTVVAAGADAVTHSAFHGLRSLRTLSAQGCRPFSSQRGGIGISEGAVALVLERSDPDDARADAALALLLGCGASNEASDLTTPSAAGIACAVATALADALLDPDEVDLINAHGSGTRLGDAAEVRALRSVFRERLKDIALVGSKGALGHWQGAAGLLEALACALSLRKGAITPTHGAEPVDGAWRDLDVVRETRATELRAALSISSGLDGGSTAAGLAGAR
jgi:3-oxoacyl-[acyl-carrier-protein] synthase II